MDGQVCDMVTTDTDTAEGIVEGEGETYDRPPRDGGLRGSVHRIGQRPEAPKVDVVSDGIVVVEDEWAGKGVAIRGDARQDNDHDCRSPPSIRRRNLWFLIPILHVERLQDVPIGCHSAFASMG